MNWGGISAAGAGDAAGEAAGDAVDEIVDCGAFGGSGEFCGGMWG
jgi:hypothetical protein